MDFHALLPFPKKLLDCIETFCLAFLFVSGFFFFVSQVLAWCFSEKSQHQRRRGHIVTLEDLCEDVFPVEVRHRQVGTGDLLDEKMRRP